MVPFHSISSVHIDSSHSYQCSTFNNIHQLYIFSPMSLFGGSSSNSPNLFNNSGSNNPPAGIFGNSSNAGGMFNNNTSTQSQPNSGTQPATSIFGNSATSNQPAVNSLQTNPNKPAIFDNIAKPLTAASSPATNMFGSNPTANQGGQPSSLGGMFSGGITAASSNAPINSTANTAKIGDNTNVSAASNPPQQAGNSLFGQKPPGTTSIFGGAASTTTNAATNPPATSLTGTGFFGSNKPNEPAANVFSNSGNAASTNPPATNPLSQPTTNPAANMFSNNATASTEQKPATGLFSNQNAPSTQTANPPTTTTSPFSQNPPANTAQTTTTQNPTTTAPQTNLFSQNPSANQGTSLTGTSNTGQTNLFGAQSNPVGAPGAQGTAPALGTNPVNPVPPRDDLQGQFQKSNQTVAETIQQFKSIFTNSYEDIKKLADSALKFLDEREQNQRITDNFTEIQKMIGNNSEVVQRTLDSLEKQQEEIAFQIEVMSRKIGEGQYTHELSDHLQQYGMLKKLVLELEEDEGEWNDPGQEQIINMFDSLNQVQVQIKEMNELVDVYLRDN